MGLHDKLKTWTFPWHCYLLTLSIDACGLNLISYFYTFFCPKLACIIFKIGSSFSILWAFCCTFLKVFHYIIFWEIFIQTCVLIWTICPCYPRSLHCSIRRELSRVNSLLKLNVYVHLSKGDIFASSVPRLISQLYQKGSWLCTQRHRWNN